MKNRAFHFRLDRSDTGGMGGKHGAFIILIIMGTMNALVWGCAPKVHVAPPPSRTIMPPVGQAPAPVPETARRQLPRMGYTIQVGAFSRVENAVRLTKSLEAQGLPAFYFAHGSGLYKVRFGNYPTWKEARSAADRIREAGIIDIYYIVRPDEYVQAKGGTPGARSLRDEIVATAQSFVGLPYQWCDASTNAVLDCSGLASAVYQLNGLNLPRTSEDQFTSGFSVEKDQLQKGDLVFFATSWTNRISHVGIYIGDNHFIHAPGKGKTIRSESLSSAYYQEHYRGACTYLR